MRVRVRRRGARPEHDGRRAQLAPRVALVAEDHGGLGRGGGGGGRRRGRGAGECEGGEVVDVAQEQRVVVEQHEPIEAGERERAQLGKGAERPLALGLGLGLGLGLAWRRSRAPTGVRVRVGVGARVSLAKEPSAHWR